MTDEYTWVSLEDALSILNVKTRGALYYYVGKVDGIRSRKGQNERDNEYNVADLKRVRARRGARKNKKTATQAHHDYILEWLTPADLGAVLDLDMLVYSKSWIGDFNLYKTWIEKNTHVALCVFENKRDDGGRRACLAYISALPLPEALIISIMRGEKEELDIAASEIQTYEKEGPYTLLVNSVVCSHEKYLSIVLNGVLDFWRANYPYRHISKIYAQAASDTGRMLIQKMRMGPIYLLENDVPHALDNAYMLDLSFPAASPIIRRFQESLH